jgi:hypothetical protein
VQVTNLDDIVATSQNFVDMESVGLWLRGQQEELTRLSDDDDAYAEYHNYLEAQVRSGDTSDELCESLTFVVAEELQTDDIMLQWSMLLQGMHAYMARRAGVRAVQQHAHGSHLQLAGTSAVAHRTQFSIRVTPQTRKRCSGWPLWSQCL